MECGSQLWVPGTRVPATRAPGSWYQPPHLCYPVEGAGLPQLRCLLLLRPQVRSRDSVGGASARLDAGMAGRGGGPWCQAAGVEEGRTPSQLLLGPDQRPTRHSFLSPTMSAKPRTHQKEKYTYHLRIYVPYTVLKYIGK